MPSSKKEKLEDFAQALARGVDAKQASDEAGYAYKKQRTLKRAAQAEMIARVKEIQRIRDWTGSSDLRPVIDKLLDLAEAAQAMDSGIGHATALRAFVAIARLKTMLPGAAEPEWVRPEPVLDEEAWSARFASPAT